MVEIKIIKCDLCGKEIKDEHYMNEIIIKSESRTLDGNWDVCQNCAEKISSKIESLKVEK